MIQGLHLVMAAVMTAWVAAPAAAQAGRIQGFVHDTDGDPIKGATIRAVHPDAGAFGMTATTDSSGRFALLGMRVSPGWQFIAEAPGYFPAEGTARVRSQMGAPLVFIMRRDPGPLPGALDRDIMERLAAAHALRDAGRHDQAIAAYQAILSRNAKLTSVNLVLAGVYRAKAEREPDGATRRTLLEQAASAYQAFLKDDGQNERAKQDLAAVTADLETLTR
jgi:tetratricopeptide (TPR) repeat protein